MPFLRPLVGNSVTIFPIIFSRHEGGRVSGSDDMLRQELGQVWSF